MKILEKYYPNGYADSVFAIDYEKLYEIGYRGIIFDIDNTLVHHGDDSTDEVDELFRRIHSTGLKTILLTNNDEERVRRFIRNIDTPFICDADKPNIKGYLKAVSELGIKRSEAVVIGDQIFTDIIGAKNSGIAGVLVRFIKLPEEKWIGKRRYIEKLILWSWRRKGRCGEIGDIYLQKRD